jgi:hypothetical protein
MKKTLLIVASIIALGICYYITKPDSLTGIVDRNIDEINALKGYSTLGSTVVDKRNGDSSDYGISVHSSKNGYLILFKKGKIIDSLFIEKLKVDETKEYAEIQFSTCRLNKRRDTGIIALIKGPNSDFDDKEFFDHVVKAWRADIETQKLISLPDVHGIDCENEGYGLF